MTRQRVGMVVVAAWVPVTALVIGSLMVGHTAPMPSPTRLDAFRAALAAVDGPPARVVHVIAAGCTCTDRLVDHLIARGADGAERVVFAGPMRPRHEGLAQAGYAVTRISTGDLERAWGLDAAPVLAVVDGEELRYIGGYYRFPAAVNPLDVQVLDAVARGERVEPLPVFGCAVAPDLQRQLDPLGLQR